MFRHWWKLNCEFQVGGGFRVGVLRVFRFFFFFFWGGGVSGFRV